MVVGLQGRGKTTLLSVLRDPTAPLPENISTVGVNVADWVVKAPPEVIKRFKGVTSRVSTGGGGRGVVTWTIKLYEWICEIKLKGYNRTTKRKVFFCLEIMVD